jgi:predicted DNA-binding transcriptional regulator YafY
LSPETRRREKSFSEREMRKFDAEKAGETKTERPARERPRRPNYKAAMNIAATVAEVYSRPMGIRLDRLPALLSVSERTVKRYVAALQDNFTDSLGRPRLTIADSGGTRFLRLAAPAPHADPNRYQAAAFFFTMALLRFMRGTAIWQGVSDIWRRMLASMPPAKRMDLNEIGRKFFAVEYAPKDYRRFNDQLDLMLRAIIEQHRVRVAYRGIAGEERAHDFDPFTLIAYRGGLYLLGRSNLHREPIYMAVERIAKVEFVAGPNGERVRYEIPAKYDPEKYTDGTFGLIDGPETQVELLIHNEETERYLRDRKFHPRQRMRRRADGKFLLTLPVRGTTELRNWILGFGPWVEVLKPVELREEVATLLTEAKRMYGPKRRAKVKRAGAIEAPSQEAVDSALDG